MDFRTVIVWEKLIIALKCSHLCTLKVSHDSPAMKSFFGLLNIKPCPLYLNNSKLHLMLCGLTHHTQFKIPSNRPLIKCSLFNCREMNICWFWQAGWSWRSHHSLKRKSLLLEPWLFSSACGSSSWPVLQMQTFHMENETLDLLSLRFKPPQVIWQQDYFGTHSAWRGKCYREDQAQSLMVAIYSSAKGRAESWTFHTSTFPEVG